jgi:hypothetical protein
VVVVAAAGLIVVPWQTPAADYFLPLGPMPEPKAIESRCVRGTVSRDAVRHVIAASGYRFEPFLGPGDDVSYVDHNLDRGGGAMLSYRPGVATMVPAKRLQTDVFASHDVVRSSSRSQSVMALGIGTVKP